MSKAIKNAALWPSQDGNDLDAVRAKARAEGLRRARRPDDVQVRLRPWLEKVSPTWDWDARHLARLQTALDDIHNHRITKLIVEMPPRHGKSELTTVRFPMYELAEDPTKRFIVGSYAQALAAKFSRKARRIARDAGIVMSRERKAVDDWETEAGGGLRAAGVEGGVTGMGANGIVIDDPFKSRKQANSQLYRDQVWDWYAEDVTSRLEPGGWIIVIMTRWHEDDLIGRILLSEDAPNWTRLRLPALAEPHDPLGRKEGEALWPARYDAVALKSIRTIMGEWAFASLYQQNPQPKEGNLFPRGSVNFIDPADVPPLFKAGRYWDKAGTRDKDAAMTCGIRGGITSDNPETADFYITDMVMGQWEPGPRNRIMKEVAELDTRSLRIYVEQEPGSGGKESAQYSQVLFSGWAVTIDRVSDAKELRWDVLSPLWHQGRVFLTRGTWNKPFLDIMERIPSGKWKDPADAASGLYIMLQPPLRARPPRTGGASYYSMSP